MGGGFFGDVVAVAPRRMIVQRAFQVGPFRGAWQLAFLGGVNCRDLRAHLGRDVGEVERPDFILGGAGDAEFSGRGFSLDLNRPYSLRRKPRARDGSLSHDDVVFFAAGSRRARKENSLIRDHA